MRCGKSSGSWPRIGSELVWRRASGWRLHRLSGASRQRGADRERHGGGGGSDQSHSPASYYKGAKPTAPAAFLTVHAGKYLVTRSSEYEWVIMPLQMRVYGFDDSLKPMSTKDIRVELTVQLPAENRPSHIVFQYVAAGAGEQDYLVAPFDTKQLRDKETPMTLDLSNLPDRKQPTASFSPVFTPERIRPYVAQVLLRKVYVPDVARGSASARYAARCWAATGGW